MAIPDHIKDNVRAVLLSKTDGSGVLVSSFMKDYKAMLHENLQYKDYGFQTIQDFIEALPDVCRLEFSKKDMAYRMYGISKPNTFVSSFVKRAEGGDTKETNGRKGKKGHNDTPAENYLCLGSTLDEEWEPNWQGVYTLCFPNKKGNGLGTKEAVAKQFSKAGEVVDINIIKQLTFVRYKDQVGAKTALRIWGESLGLKRADEKTKKPTENGKNKENKDNKNNLNKPPSKNNDCIIADMKLNVEQTHRLSMSSTDTDLDKVEEPEQLVQVYIGNWPNEGTMADLEEVLKGFNHIGCRIRQGKGYSRKRYAFADFKSMSEAQRLIDIMNGQRFMSRNLVLRLGDKDSESEKDSTSGPQKHQIGNTRNIEEEFERLFVHRGKETKISPTTVISKTITNKRENKDSVTNGGASSNNSDSPTRMPPLESLNPELDDSMPELEPLGSPEKQDANSHSTKGRYRNDYDDMPELQPIAPTSPARSNVSSTQDSDSVQSFQLFISNFPYGTKEWELQQLVDPYGGHSLVIMNKDVANRSTYAFVTFDDLQQAQMAILNLDQSILKNRCLTVAMANTEVLGSNTTSPNVSFNSAPLARITCTVGGNNGRMVSMQDTSMMDQSLSQISPISRSNLPSEESGSNKLFVSRREDGFNYQKFTILIKDYSKIVVKLRGDDDFQFYPRQKMNVMITHVENERFFWGQVISDNERGVYPNLETLSKIMADLQTFERKKCINGMGRCMAPFEGEWYRAWCTHVIERGRETMADVFYIDYGNSALIPISQAFYTFPPVWTIPPVAKPFKLHEPLCQLKSMLNQIVVVEMIEPGVCMSNYLSTVHIDLR